MPTKTNIAKPDTGDCRTRRAAPLSPPERRAAIIAATLPLMRAHGRSVTTRQIAAAAGVAEGTIFGVFADKDALLKATVEAAFDPAPVEAQLATVDLGLPLEDRLVTAVEILQLHLASIWELMSTPGMVRMLGGVRGRAKAAKRGAMADFSTLTRLLEPDRDRLRKEPVAAARVMVGLTLAGSHPGVVGDSPMAAADIVSVLLDGIRFAGPATTTETARVTSA